MSKIKFYNKHSSSIDLSMNDIGDKEAIILANALKSYCDLLYLNLSMNKIWDIGVESLAKALNHGILRELNLLANNIGDNGAFILASALATNNTLETLHLNSNSIGNAGASALAEVLNTNTTLTHLALDGNDIDNIDSFGLVFATNTTLKILGVGNNEIGDISAISFFESLKTNQSLIELRINNNRFGEIGLIQLTLMLGTNNTLKTLDLRNSKINNTGIELIANALKINTGLEKINLEWNIFDEYLPLKSAFEYNTTILEKPCYIDDEAINTYITQACKKNEKMYMGTYFTRLNYYNMPDLLKKALTTTLLFGMIKHDNMVQSILPMRVWVIIFQFWTRKDWS
jgi:Ran GTPase-activating protein (RanGAP) involved in mRNA processing and transport